MRKKLINFLSHNLLAKHYCKTFSLVYFLFFVSCECDSACWIISWTPPQSFFFLFTPETINLSQFHKAKKCWNENGWSRGIMSNFWGQFLSSPFVCRTSGASKNREKYFSSFSSFFPHFFLHLSFLKILTEVWGSWRFCSTLDLLIITSFRIGVSSILFSCVLLQIFFFNFKKKSSVRTERLHKMK